MSKALSESIPYLAPVEAYSNNLAWRQGRTTGGGACWKLGVGMETSSSMGRTWAKSWGKDAEPQMPTETNESTGGRMNDMEERKFSDSGMQNSVDGEQSHKPTPALSGTWM